MRKLQLVPRNLRIPVNAWRHWAYGISGAAAIVSALLFLILGLNYGIDFRGGVLIELGSDKPIAIGDLRASLSRAVSGDLQVQRFGSDREALVRLEVEEGAGGAEGAAGAADAAQAKTDGTGAREMAQLGIIKSALGDAYDYRRVEIVGPKVSRELIIAGFTAILAAVALVLVYIWIRFEWQFSLGAVLALIHDVILTIGVFSLTRIEFNLSIIAAILTIVGYSLNDTVVVYDRVRENLRKYKRMPLGALVDLSVRQTLSRTFMTSLTTLLALAALYGLGGAVIAGFTFAMIWGVFVGTYSSIFIAAPLLLFLGVEREWNR